MREIREYRGKRKDGKGWVYGWYIKTDFAVYIVPAEYVVNWKVFIEVIPETVGEFTGKEDKNGVKIYEGDTILPKGNKTYYFVKWCNNGWKLRHAIPKNSGSYIDFNYVIGGQVKG